MFCFNFGTAVANTFNKYKKMSPRKKFLETLSFVLPAKTTVGLMVQRTVVSLIVRGGVQDTRLEAKAKDTKKIRGQGQGQPFRGQTLLRPRTGMLKDQGHKRNCSPKKNKRSSQKFLGDLQNKKKGLHKNFSSDLQKKRFPKIFSSASQNFNNSKNSAVLEPMTGQFSRT